MIPPIVQQVIGTLVRHLLGWFAGALATRGIVISDDQTTQLVTAITTVLIPVGWSLWKNHRGRQKLLVAAGSPTVMTEAEVEAKVADPNVKTPSVLTGKTEVPQ